ncbi:MAG: outer membrane protein assembly factor BamC [Pseudomonadota bacterium]|nr:MAG: outer membrane protein assembly factor BamC [Pseudomonadota bacterium]
MLRVTIQLAVVVVSVWVLLASSGCASSRKAVYDKSEEARPLEVPPGLSTPEGDPAMTVPAIAPDQATYSSYSSGGEPSYKGGPVLLGDQKGMRLVRDGNTRYLEINAPPEAIWPKLEEFLRKLGFDLVFEDPRLGVIETDWQDNRAGGPSGWFGKWFGGIFSDGIRDKYRARLERLPQDDRTLVFIAHRGMHEVGAEGTTPDHVSTEWAWRDPDPELEVELLMRFMVYMGADEKVAKEMVATAPEIKRAALLEEEGSVSLQVTESFARTWRRTGLALDRMGLVVEDRNRTAGTYYVKAPLEFLEANKEGWLARMFTGKEKPSTDKFLVSLQDTGESTRVRVRGREGVDEPRVERQILERLELYLR